MTTVKNEVFIGLYPEKCYLIGGIFSNGENEQISG